MTPETLTAPVPAEISPEAAAARTDRVRAALAERGVDAAILHDPATVRHLTGLGEQRWPVALIITPGASTLASFAAAQQRAAATRQIVIEAFPYDRVVSHPLELIRELGPVVDAMAASAAAIGIEAPSAPGWLWSLLRERGLEARVQDVSDVLAAQRRAKDPDEIAVTTYNAALAAAAYARAAEMIRPGVSEIEVYVEMVRTVQELAGGPVPHVGDFASGPGGGARGGWPTERRCEEGDSYVIDFQLGRNGYWTDLCRTFAVGPPRAELLDALDVMHDTMEAMEAAIRPGTPLADADRLLRERMSVRPDFGGSDIFHIVGHGIGILNHEPPWVVAGSDEVFVAGDVISIEPGYYADVLVGGARTEDNYVVTESGLRALSLAPRRPFAG